MTPPPDEALWRKRFQIMALSRFLALPLVVLGAMNQNKRFLPDYSPWLGMGMMLIGVFVFFLLPVLLKRRWIKDEGS